MTPIYTRLMTTTEYGKYSIFNSWESIVTIFITLNLSWGVYNQGLVKYEEDRKRYSSSMQGLTLTLLLIWTCIYLTFRNTFNLIFSLSTEYMLLMLLDIWCAAIFGFWASEQRVDFKYKHLVIITVLVSIMSPILTIVLMTTMNDIVLARILGPTMVSAFAYLWMFVYHMKKGKSFFLKKYWKHAISFNIPLVPHYLSQTVLSSADRIMIEKINNVSSAGIYNLAYSISMIMTVFNSALSQTISPWMYKKIKYKQFKDIARIAYPTLILIAIVNIILIAFAPEAVKIFAPSSYYDAIWVIPPIAMSVYFMFAYDLFAKFEFYYEKTKFIAIATILCAVLNIILNYFFIDRFGYFSAGYTTLICYIFYALFHYIFMRKVCKQYCNNIQPYDTIILLKITVSFLLFGFAFLFLYNYQIIRYMVIVAFCIIIFIYRKKIINIIKNILSVNENKIL